MKSSFRELIFFVLFLVAVLAGLLQSACSSKSKVEEPVAKKPMMIDEKPAVRFSENNSMVNVNDRSYRRMTRQRLEEESELQSSAGSMWVMDGQGAYLFAQNRSRREGDLLTVKIEGPAQKQIETKVGVIKLLLKQLEEEELKRKADEQKANEKDKPKVDEQKLAADGANAAEKRAPAAAPADASKAQKEEEVVANVPTRITERMSDGSYRVKGQQPFMIGKREYKVLVTGVIRPEDFNDEGISSNKLLDPQFDVVSLRRKETR